MSHPNPNHIANWMVRPTGWDYNLMIRAYLHDDPIAHAQLAYNTTHNHNHTNTSRPIIPYVSPDPLTDASDSEVDVTVSRKRPHDNLFCTLCLNSIGPLTKTTQREDLLTWICPYKCAVYHLGCIIKRLPVPAGITDPWRVCEYRRCRRPEKVCCNKADNIVYQTMKPDGSTEIHSWYKAPPPKGEPIVAFDNWPGCIPLSRMR
jgi:hypothetical protein